MRSNLIDRIVNKVIDKIEELRDRIVFPIFTLLVRIDYWFQKQEKQQRGDMS